MLLYGQKIKLHRRYTKLLSRSLLRADGFKDSVLSVFRKFPIPNLELGQVVDCDQVQLLAGQRQYSHEVPDHLVRWHTVFSLDGRHHGDRHSR